MILKDFSVKIWTYCCFISQEMSTVKEGHLDPCMSFLRLFLLNSLFSCCCDSFLYSFILLFITLFCLPQTFSFCISNGSLPLPSILVSKNLIRKGEKKRKKNDSFLSNLPFNSFCFNHCFHLLWLNILIYKHRSQINQVWHFYLNTNWLFSNKKTIQLLLIKCWWTNFESGVKLFESSWQRCWEPLFSQ